MAALPAALRAFHLPATSRGVYAKGRLSVSGLGRFLFPSQPQTIVRTTPLHGDRVRWTRSFGGSVFLESTYRRSSTAEAGTLHDIEAVFPLEFQFDWTTAATGQRVTPQLVGVSLLGVVPLPRWLVSLELIMDCHADGSGWHLTADVRAAAGAVQLICCVKPRARTCNCSVQFAAAARGPDCGGGESVAETAPNRPLRALSADTHRWLARFCLFWGFLGRPQACVWCQGTLGSEKASTFYLPCMGQNVLTWTLVSTLIG